MHCYYFWSSERSLMESVWPGCLLQPPFIHFPGKEQFVWNEVKWRVLKVFFFLHPLSFFVVVGKTLKLQWRRAPCVNATSCKFMLQSIFSFQESYQHDKQQKSAWSSSLVGSPSGERQSHRQGLDFGIGLTGMVSYINWFHFINTQINVLLKMLKTELYGYAKRFLVFY